MDKRKLMNYKITLLGILECATEDRHPVIIKLLEEAESKVKDSSFKEFIESRKYRQLEDYYDKVNFLVNDLFDVGKKEEEKRNKILVELIEKLKPETEKATRNWIDKFISVFKHV